MTRKIVAFLFLAVVLGSAVLYIFRREQSIQGGVNPSDFFEAYYYEPLDQNRVQCFLCPNFCTLANGQFGICKARKNIDGKLYSMNYGRVAALHVDPIEKKPLFHFLPGSKVFSVGTTGCNMRCVFCQNWEISQAFPEQVKTQDISPEKLVESALRSGARSIAFTYNEPVIAYEFMIETFKIAKSRGLRTTVISSGYIEEGPLRELLKYTDAYKVDLKAFHEDFYRELTGGRLNDVLKTLKIIRETGVWLEIVTLIIPEKNDSPDELRTLANWIRENLGPDVPLHFSRFFPQYKLSNLPPTPPETLIRAREIAIASGLKFVYTGNVAFPEGETTWCPGSQKIAIARQGYFITQNNLKEGACPDGEKIPGVWD